MGITVRLDERLVTKAFELGKHSTKKAAVTEALREYIEHLQQLDILKVFGTIEYDQSYDYKEQRKRG